MSKLQPDPLPEPRVEPDRLPFLRWSKARLIANSKLPQAAVLIPAVGYALLWGDELDKLAAFTKLNPPLWFSPMVRLQLLYFGAIFMTVGWFMYLWQCPKIIRRSAEVDDYVLEELRARDVYRFQKIRRAAENYLSKTNFHSNTNDPLIYGNFSPHGLQRAVGSTGANEVFSKDISASAAASLFAWHYFTIDRSRKNWCYVVLTFLGLGAFIFLLPSVEVFLMVLRKFTFG